MACIVLWRDKQHLDVALPADTDTNTVPHTPDNLTETVPVVTDSGVQNHVRSFEAKDGLWYVELDACSARSTTRR
jgi:hypothetical protein